MTEYLFAPPIWLIPALLAAGFAIFWAGNKRLDKTMKRLGAVVMLGAIAWAFVAYFIDTPQEIVTRQTKAFVQAVVNHDTRTLDTLLDPHVQVGIWNKQDILDGVKEYADRFGLKGAHITGLETVDHPPQLTTNFVVFSEHDAPSLPSTIRTAWQFDWTQEADGWKLLRITYVPFKDQDPNAVANQYFNRKPR